MTLPPSPCPQLKPKPKLSSGRSSAAWSAASARTTGSTWTDAAPGRRGGARNDAGHSEGVRSFDVYRSTDLPSSFSDGFRWLPTPCAFTRRGCVNVSVFFLLLLLLFSFVTTVPRVGNAVQLCLRSGCDTESRTTSLSLCGMFTIKRRRVGRMLQGRAGRESHESVLSIHGTFM